MINGLIAEKVAQVWVNIEKSCERSGRKSSSVTLIAVTKGVSLESIQEVVRSGIEHLGENRLQEAEQKIKRFSGQPVRWHFIGRLQTNKLKKVIELFHSIQSLDSVKQASALHNHLVLRGMSHFPVLVQVNLSGATNQGGVTEEGLVPFLDYLQGKPQFRVNGLMTIAPFRRDKAEIRDCFRRLRELLEMVNCRGITGYPLRELSMGMSEDYEMAIEEGATTVRLGRVLFGERSL